jgi:hypothetical protein
MALRPESLETPDLDNVGSSTSHSPIGLQDLLGGYVYYIIYIISYCYGFIKLIVEHLFARVGSHGYLTYRYIHTLLSVMTHCLNIHFARSFCNREKAVWEMNLCRLLSRMICFVSCSVACICRFHQSHCMRICCKAILPDISPTSGFTLKIIFKLVEVVVFNETLPRSLLSP